MNVCVFCASSEVDKSYFKVAEELGTLLAATGWDLLYGGTNCGLMREISDSVEKAGGRVTGVIPQCIVDKGRAAKGLNRLIVTPDMKERKSVMRDMADAFIVLPGGWGTLEEATEVVTLKQLGQHNKPIVFLDVNNYFEYFFLFVHNARKEHFISSAYDNLYLVTDDVKEAVEYIRTYAPSEISDKY